MNTHADAFAKPFVVCNTAGNEYAVHLTFEYCSHLTDHLRNLVGHGIIDQGGFFIAVFNHLLHFIGTVGTEVCTKSTTANQHLFQFLESVFSGVTEFCQVDGWQGAGTFGGEGTFTTNGMVHIYYPSFFVGAHRNTASKMSNDKVQFFVFFVLYLRMPAGSGFLVKGMEN